MFIHSDLRDNKVEALFEQDDWEAIVAMSPDQPSITHSLHLRTVFDKMAKVTVVAGLYDLLCYLGGHIYEPCNLWLIGVLSNL